MVAELPSGGGTALGSLFYATPAISNLTVAVIPHKGTPHLGNPQVPLKQCFPKHLTVTFVTCPVKPFVETGMKRTSLTLPSPS